MFVVLLRREREGERERARESEREREGEREGEGVMKDRERFLLSSPRMDMSYLSTFCLNFLTATVSPSH
jgi:hypothetical protein